MFKHNNLKKRYNSNGDIMKKNNKKIMIIKTIIIFLSLFLFSNGYKIFPNFLTAIFFPVNESLFEHLKMIYITEIIISLIIFIILKIKNIKVNNYFSSLLISTIFNIILFYIIYLPIYNRFGEGLTYTMIIYFTTLLISQYLFYLITNCHHHDFYNKLSLVIIPIIWIGLIYFTFNPLHTKFFFDPIKEIYGIPK